MRFLLPGNRFKQSFLFSLLLSFFLSFTGNAQLLLKDINVGVGHSNPNKFIELGGIIYFAATTSTNGEELWRSDGTEAGTYLLKDINVGTAPSNIDEMTVMNGKLYFVATDGGVTTGKELWVTDGTTPGTVAIDVNPGTASSNPKYLRVMNNWLYFAGTSSAADGEELHKTDGTIANTVLVRDIQIGVGSSSSPKYLTVYNNEIYFSADDGNTGVELWKSDGASVGTVQVSDIQVGTSGSGPSKFCVANNILFFTANTLAEGEELYKTTGTVVNILSLISGSVSYSPEELYAFNNKLYFSAFNGSGFRRLWTSDGTNQVVPILTNALTSPSDFMGWNGNLYFNSSNNGGQLNIFNGATLESDIDAKPSGSFAVYNNRLFFTANNGDEIWISNGTAASTELAMTSSNVAELTSAAGKLFFKAGGAANGSEVRFIGDCNPARPGTTMTMIKDPGLHYSLFETVDAGGWSHYCDCSNTILLSLKKGSSGVVIPTDSVSIKIDTIMAHFYLTNCPNETMNGCFITNADGGAVIFNRTWDVRPSTQPSSEVPVRFYFSNQEYNAVNFEFDDLGAPLLTGPDQMSFYKVTNQTLGAHPLVKDIKVGDVTVLTHIDTVAAPPEEVSTTKWAHSNIFGTDHCAEIKVTSFSGGGGGAGPSGSPLPVEMMYFWARPIIPDNTVRLEWGTASEINNYGFYIERSPDLENWQIIGFQAANTTGASPAIYKYLDQNPLPGDNYYRLRQRDFDGTEEFSKITHVTMDIFIVGEIFPNPVSVNAIVQLDVTAPVEGDATISIFNLSRQLLQQEQVNLSQGPQFIPLNLQSLPAGMYVIKVESQGLVVNTRLLIQE